MDRRIAIGCDHGGFALKKELIPFIDSLGYETIDIGCYDENSVDYPDVAFSLAEKVGSGEISRGIIVCGTGIGVSIAPTRCAECAARFARTKLWPALRAEHNDTNMLALGGRVVGTELAKGIVKTWLETEFSNGQRHINRIAKITQYENK